MIDLASSCPQKGARIKQKAGPFYKDTQDIFITGKTTTKLSFYGLLLGCWIL
jgi:hypothetical protein